MQPNSRHMLSWLTSAPKLNLRISSTRRMPVCRYDNKGSVGRYSVAPMMDVTDRHFRYLARLISQRATLWTEMVVDRTIIHNEMARELELRLPPCSNPTVLQLGGSEPETLATACQLAAEHKYVEVNLNCGCPSPKVAGKGCFGAALMKEPKNVAAMLRSMRNALPKHMEVSVKHRLGVDDCADYEDTHKFVKTVSEMAEVKHFVVHARAALLNGINPKQNREIPPLRHENVFRLVDEFPHLQFSINGGIRDVSHAKDLLDMGVAGVMVGRAVRDNPWRAMADVDNLIYGVDRVTSRREVVQRYCEYADEEHANNGCPQRVLVKPMLNLFHGEPRGKLFRRRCDELLRDGNNSVSDILFGALSVLKNDVLDAAPKSLAERVEEQILV